MGEVEARGDRGISIGPIRDDEIPVVAAMHLGGAEAAPGRCGGRLRFYLDKVSFYAREERDGLLVARAEGRPVGFIIATASRRRIVGRMIFGGYLARWAVRALLGLYGGAGIIARIAPRLRRRASGSEGIGDRPSAGALRPGRRTDPRIESIVTLPSERRRGIGSRLLAAAEGYLATKGARRAGLAVVEVNRAARTFYARAGWEIVGRTAVAGAPAFVMGKRLGGPRRIAHVVTRMIPGGAQRVVSALIEAGIAAGDEVILIAGRDRGDAPVIEGLRGSPVRLEIVTSLVRLPHPVRDLRAALRLLRLLRALDPDVVHTHTSKAGILGRWAAARAGVPRIVHSSHGHPFAIHGRLAGAFYACLERWAARRCDAIAVLSRDERDAFLRRRVGEEAQYAVIGNGVSPAAFEVDPGRASEIRGSIPGPSDCPVVGTLCRLSFEKGLEDLLDGFAALRAPARLLIVGEGPMRGELEARARWLGIEGRVLFAGLQAPPNDWLAAMDVFVLPSTYEGFGMAALEAMAAARPVIVARVGGLAELVEDGRTGIVIPPRDPRALAEAIERLLRDIDLRLRLGAAAREAARERTDARMIEAYFRLYGQGAPSQEEPRCGEHPT